jgi:hypothetical protein
MADNTPLGQWSGSDATKQLEETIKRAQLENAKQQGTMLKWTITSALCALVALIVSLVALLHTR